METVFQKGPKTVFKKMSIVALILTAAREKSRASLSPDPNGIIVN